MLDTTDLEKRTVKAPKMSSGHDKLELTTYAFNMHKNGHIHAWNHEWSQY